MDIVRTTILDYLLPSSRKRVHNKVKSLRYPTMSRSTPNRESAVVPAVSVPSSLVCLRSLGKRGIHTIGISERDSPEIFCSKYCDETVRVPSPKQDYREYKDALLALAERSDVRTIIPVREEDVYVLSKHHSEFKKYANIPVPDFEKLRKVQDRIKLFGIAKDVGVPIPETKLLTECDDWSRKWIVKGRYSLLTDVYLSEIVDSGSTVTKSDGGSNSLVPPPSTEYLSFGKKADVKGICEAAGHVPLVQEFMPDTDEYGFFAFYDHGEAIATFQHRQIRGFNYSGGPSAFRESVSMPDLEEEGLKLLDSLEWHGPAMVEFKKDARTGEFKLMEINPRFWSSLPFSVKAGADFPYYYWLVATGQQDRIEPGYDVGVSGHLLLGELFYLYSVLKDDNELVERPSIGTAAFEVLTSLIRHPRFDYLDPSDPCPALRYANNRAITPAIEKLQRKLL